MNVTDKQISALLQEAAAAGDRRQVALCALALGLYDVVGDGDVYLDIEHEDGECYHVLAESDGTEPRRFELCEGRAPGKPANAPVGWAGADWAVDVARARCAHILRARDAR